MGESWGVDHVEFRLDEYVRDTEEEPRDPYEVDYPDSVRRRLGDLERNHPWFVHRCRVVERLVRRLGRSDVIFDVGAGNGTVAAHLTRRGFHVVSVEPSGGGAARCREVGSSHVLQMDMERFAQSAQRIPVICALDVIEHLADDSAAVGLMSGCLADDGLLILTVPAHARLWSSVDEHSGHYRRYSRADVRRLLESHGLEVRYLSHLFPALYPFARWSRKRHIDDPEVAILSELDQPAAVRWVLGGLFGVERVALSMGAKFPFGTSIIAAATHSRPRR